MKKLFLIWSLITCAIVFALAAYAYRHIGGPSDDTAHRACEFMGYLAAAGMATSTSFLLIHWMYRYEYLSQRPKLGSHIEIIWLAPCKNGLHLTKNPYIGMHGTVTDVFNNGGFAINTGHSILVVTGRGECQFKYVKAPVLSSMETADESKLREALDIESFEDWLVTVPVMNAEKCLTDEVLMQYLKDKDIPKELIDKNYNRLIDFKIRVRNYWNNAKTQ